MDNPTKPTARLLREHNEADPETLAPPKKFKLSRYWGWLVGGLVGVVCLSALFLVYQGGSGLNRGHRLEPGHEPGITLAEMRQGAFQPRNLNYHWLLDSTSGEYIERDNEHMLLKALGSGASEGSTICQYEPTIDGRTRTVFDVLLNADRSKAIVKTDYIKNFRHSSTGLYWLLDVATQKYEPLGAKGQRISVAQFSPAGDKAAYVYKNNLYVRDVSGGVHQVTSDGGQQVFNGVPDWVYEEEVFSGDTAFWWSRNGKHLMYLRTNETEVPEYPLEFFVEDASEYPRVQNLKYPKPGYSNPVDDLWIYDVTARSAELVPIELPDKIVSEVVWGDDEAIVKVMTRDSDTLEVLLVDAASAKATTVRKYDALEDGGWFEITHNSVFVPKGGDREHDGYLDTVTVDGYNHLGFFSPLNSSEPRILTRGKWEVLDVEYAYNAKTNKVYFTASKESPTRKNVYSVPLEGGDIVAITSDGTYSAGYSGGAAYAKLVYKGPEVPYTQLLDLETNEVVQSLYNTDLKNALANRSLPTTHFSTAQVAEGVEVNVREIRPSGFDKSKTYPVLFYNYGGPGSQMVEESFNLDFQFVYAETHNAIVVTVDPRGTGAMGREFRSVVRDKLGYYESRDVIEVARQWNAKSYVNANATAIWGWSYGGFLTLKVLETDGGNQFKYGVAVAPVTDWRLYDSIYTERYMHTPAANPKGYQEAAINDVESMGRATRFMIMHGTGDDNVHIQNTYRLLDKFDKAGVENYDVHVFPDSDHSIFYHNANTVVYDKLDKWLREHQTGVVDAEVERR